MMLRGLLASLTDLQPLPRALIRRVCNIDMVCLKMLVAYTLISFQGINHVTFDNVVVQKVSGKLALVVDIVDSLWIRSIMSNLLSDASLSLVLETAAIRSRRIF